MNTIYNFKTVRGIELLIEKEKPMLRSAKCFSLISPSVSCVASFTDSTIGLQLSLHPNAILYTNGKSASVVLEELCTRYQQ